MCERDTSRERSAVGKVAKLIKITRAFAGVDVNKLMSLQLAKPLRILSRWLPPSCPTFFQFSQRRTLFTLARAKPEITRLAGPRTASTFFPRHGQSHGAAPGSGRSGAVSRLRPLMGLTHPPDLVQIPLPYISIYTENRRA